MVRIALGRIGFEPDGLERLGDQAPMIALDAERAQRFGDDREHGLARVERGIGVLEHDLRLAAEVAHEGAAARVERLAIEGDAATVGFGRTQQQTQQRGLARPAFAHEADGVAGGDVEIDVRENRAAGRVAEMDVCGPGRGS